jgi:hypothetical protein
MGSSYGAISSRSRFRIGSSYGAISSRSKVSNRKPVQLSNRSRVEWRWYSFRIGRREQVDLFTAACLRTDRAFITRRPHHADTLPLLAVLELRITQTVTSVSLTYSVTTDENVHELRIIQTVTSVSLTCLGITNGLYN